MTIRSANKPRATAGSSPTQVQTGPIVLVGGAFGGESSSIRQVVEEPKKLLDILSQSRRGIRRLGCHGLNKSLSSVHCARATRTVTHVERRSTIYGLPMLILI